MKGIDTREQSSLRGGALPQAFTGDAIDGGMIGRIAEAWWSYDALGLMMQLTGGGSVD